MWLRDSTNQMLPYLKYTLTDPLLAQVFVQVIRKQVSEVVLDGYANAFDKDAQSRSDAAFHVMDDVTPPMPAGMNISGSISCFGTLKSRLPEFHLLIKVSLSLNMN